LCGQSRRVFGVRPEHRGRGGSECDIAEDRQAGRGARDCTSGRVAPRDELHDASVLHSRLMNTLPRAASEVGAGAARVDISWVMPNLALGGRLAADAIGHLVSAFGIRNVVDLRSEDHDDEQLFRKHSAALLHLPTPDGSGIGTEMVHRGVAWINRQLDRGEKVFVHCEHGIGRSALLVCCVLVSRGATPRRAIERVKAARARAAPSPEQLRALLQWTGEWCRVQGRPCPPDTLAELSAVAYQHLHRRPAAPADPRRWFTF
jgi:hypothetical protein